MANLWTPIFLPFGSLANWYDSTDTTTLTLSTGNKVADWRDKSYNANDLSEADFADLPVYGTTNINGLSTVDFDEDTSINLDDEVVPLVGDCYIMYVGFNNTYTTPSTMYNFTGAGNSSLLIRRVSGSNTQLLIKDVAGVSLGNVSLILPLENQTAVYTVDIQGLDVTLEGNYSSSIAGAQSMAYPPLNKLTVGAQSIDVNGLNGQVGELIVMQSDNITVADKEKLEGYTAWKWNMQGSLPGAHPYKTAAPTVTDVEFRNKLYETSTEEGSSRFRRLFELGFVG